MHDRIILQLICFERTHGTAMVKVVHLNAYQPTCNCACTAYRLLGSVAHDNIATIGWFAALVDCCLEYSVHNTVH